MKHLQVILKSGTHWIILLFLTNLFFAFIVWLTAPKSFETILLIITLFTVMIVLAGCWINRKRQKKQIEVWESFISCLDEETEEKLLALTDEFWHPIIQTTSTHMREQIQNIKDKQLELQNYQEFIEAWIHEIKTPLSLLTLVLDNHKDDMSQHVYNRMEHVRYVIYEDIEKILYYARLHADHVDYKFEKIILNDFLQMSLDNFRAISDGKNIDLQLNILPLQIVSDKKALAFIISQILSNAFKYTASENGIVNISSWIDIHDDKKIHLAIRDNGKGVELEDVPFLFDKGFTGNHPDRQNATGMGLYLVKKYAKTLAIEVKISETSISGRGFEVELIFPDVL